MRCYEQETQLPNNPYQNESYQVTHNNWLIKSEMYSFKKSQRDIFSPSTQQYFKSRNRT